MKKICTGCGIEKPIKQYHRNGTYKGKVRYKTKCRDCEADGKSKLTTFIRNKFFKIQERCQRKKRKELECDKLISKVAQAEENLRVLRQYR